jgi:error-prone DNA polymerase
VFEADVNLSLWDNRLETGGERWLPLRLGFRQIDGFQQAWAEAIEAARASGPFDSIERFARRSGLPNRALRLLAEADGFRSLGLDRRAALWAVSRLPDDSPLPLFSFRQVDELPIEQEIILPDMRLSEHVVTDYQTTGLSLKGHPVAFLRPRLERERHLACRDLHRLRHNDRASIVGVILVRQKPGSAKGVVFMTIEDETGIANVVIWKSVVERFRREVMGARLLEVRGEVQKRPEGILHLVANRLIDRSPELLSLSETPMRTALARADEVARPVAEDRRTLPRHTHPRNVRILPRSRDFH